MHQATAFELYGRSSHLFNLLLITLPIDLALLLSLRSITSTLPRLDDLGLVASGLVIFALLINERSAMHGAISFLRRMKRALADDGQQMKRRLVATSVVAVVALDLLARLLHFSWKGMGLAAVAVLVIVIACAKSYFEMKSWSDKLSKDKQLAQDLHNVENFYLSLLPALILRSAAFIAALLLSTGSNMLTSLTLYLIAAASLQNSAPRKEDFFMICFRCARHYPRESHDLKMCRSCSFATRKI